MRTGPPDAVILASVPRRPANYIQRVGRAGRRTGNSLLVTIAGQGPRDSYYLQDPLQMIAGDVAPPGAYLAAVEILCRQYLAHLVDLAARGRLPGVLPLPRRASVLFGPTGWLEDLVAVAQERSSELAEGFFALFPIDPDETDPAAMARSQDALRVFAVHGLGEIRVLLPAVTIRVPQRPAKASSPAPASTVCATPTARAITANSNTPDRCSSSPPPAPATTSPSSGTPPLARFLPTATT